MASFTEFLKSGKSAREFIDTAILPQHVLPVGQTEFTPAPYGDEELEANCNGADAVLNSATDSLPEAPSGDDKAVDMGEEGQEMIEGLDDIKDDDEMIEALKSYEKIVLK